MNTPIVISKAMTALVKEHQCSGCTHGSSPKNCSKFEMVNAGGPEGGLRCNGHYSGTTVFPGGKLFLGMPVGFNKFVADESCRIRLWERGTAPEWDSLNVPVWASKKDGKLFVRTLLPRKAMMYIDVIEDENTVVPTFTYPIDPSTLDID